MMVRVEGKVFFFFLPVSPKSYCLTMLEAVKLSSPIVGELNLYLFLSSLRNYINTPLKRFKEKDMYNGKSGKKEFATTIDKIRI